MANAEVLESRVCGIVRSKVSEAAVDEGLKLVDVVPGPGATLDKKVELLVQHFAKVDREAGGRSPDIIKCNNCEAASHRDLVRCPFCGVGEDDPAPAASDDLPGIDESPDAGDQDVPPDDYRDVEADAAVEAEGEPPAPEPHRDLPRDLPVPPGAQDAEPTAITEPEALALSGEDGQKLVKRPRKSKKQEGPGLAKTKPGQGTLAIPPATPASAPVVEGRFETELDRQVAEIKKLQGDIDRMAAAGWWVLAKKLAEVETSGVWKTRLGPTGKPVYKQFGDFTEAECGLGRNYTRDLLKVCARYSEDEYKLGQTKLRVLMQVTDTEQHDKLLGQMKQGAAEGRPVPRREIEKVVGRTGVHTLGAAAAPARPAPAKPVPPPKPQPGKVTVAFVEERVKVPFFIKGNKRDMADGGKPAKRIGDTPWARIPLTNDVFLLVTLTTNRNNEIVGTVEFKRVDPTK